MQRITDTDWSIKGITDFGPSLNRFRRYLEDQGRREATIEGYLGNVNRYLKFAKTDRPLDQDLERFRNSLAEKKTSRSTKNQYNYAIRAYHAMLGEKIEVKRLEPNNQIPYYFDNQDVIKIFSVIHNLKHLAMLQTLFYGALRASELCNLDVSDVDLKNLNLRINNGKRGKDRISLINNECAATLRRYLEVKPSLTIEGREPLFFTEFGQRWNRTAVHRMFSIYKKKCGIEKRGGVHVFARHTTATLMIANGCDISVVKDLLGHSDLRTTLRYAHVSDATKREKYNRFLVL
jgi:integrase/recombinase XerD